MNDERRDRYALALSTLDGWRAEHVADHGQRQEYYEAADAAMAVADEEITRALDAERSNAARYLFERDAALDENARLRAQLKSALMQIDDRRIELLCANKRHRAETSGLRAELRGAHAGAKSLRDENARIGAKLTKVTAERDSWEDAFYGQG